MPLQLALWHLHGGLGTSDHPPGVPPPCNALLHVLAMLLAELPGIENPSVDPFPIARRSVCQSTQLPGMEPALPHRSRRQPRLAPGLRGWPSLPDVMSLPNHCHGTFGSADCLLPHPPSRVSCPSAKPANPGADAKTRENEKLNIADLAGSWLEPGELTDLAVVLKEVRSELVIIISLDAMARF